ncbi:MAG: hypothetical protein P4L84_37850 [Isosphaeraceae bacterium]|nr:hypothetical protein [Isosphaeraceae bacterium]
MSEQESHSSNGDDMSPLLCTRRLNLCVSILHEASVLARKAGSDPWQFAVEIAELRGLGLRHSDLRWLVSEGYIEHAEEKTRPKDKRRVFLKVENFAFRPSTSFVLTARGEKLTAQPGRALLEADKAHPLSIKVSINPRWDPDRRELTWNDRLIKKFRLPAENQERILIAFEEAGWPVRIEDPLHRTHKIDPKIRLHESIKSLNRNQTFPVLRFTGDGRGQGVIWGLCSPNVPTSLLQGQRR